MGRIGPSRLPMSSYFGAVRQTWRACPSVFVGLCSLKSLGECLGVISASCLPASLLPHLSPRSAFSLTWTRSLYGWRRNMIKTSSWADSKSCWGGGGRWAVRLHHESNEKGLENKWHEAGAAVPNVYVLRFSSLLSRNDDIWGVATVQGGMNADETGTRLPDPMNK